MLLPSVIFHLSGRGREGRTFKLSLEGGHTVVGPLLHRGRAARRAAPLLLLLALRRRRGWRGVCVQAWPVSHSFSFLLKLALTWYCNYWWRDDKGIDLEVGDVWHVRPVGARAVTGVQAGDEIGVSSLKPAILAEFNDF